MITRDGLFRAYYSISKSQKCRRAAVIRQTCYHAADELDFLMIMESLSTGLAKRVVSASQGAPWIGLDAVANSDGLTKQIGATLGVGGLNFYVVKSYTKSHIGICPDRW